MADTKDFDVIRVCRSDGADTGPGYWPLTAPAASTSKRPSAEKAPRAKPQMARLQEDDPRFTEWRVKLGILLKQELSPNPEEGNAWYVPFPEGYWLYEKSKHLWVSGYPVKSKLFKSPQEFALHLIWLLSASRSYKDCCCVHCNVPSLSRQTSSADDTPVIAPAEPPMKSDKAPSSKVTPVPLPPMPGQAPTKSASPAQQEQLAQKQMPPTSAFPKPATPVVPAPVPAQSQLQPVAWSLKSSLLFRVGELVWYQNGNTWRLGVVAASNSSNGHELLAIGHGMVPQQNVGKTEMDMRPFHAFSVPGVAVPELKNLVYDDVPWENMLRATINDPARRDHLALDASKMAASKIDHSYSLWSPLRDDPNTKTTSYYGSFFGAERIEIGDCLRLKSLQAELSFTSDTAIMGLRCIYTIGDYPGTLFFRGSIYMLIKGDTSSANVVPDQNLPIALREECIWRRQVSAASRWRCIFLKDNVTLQEQQIRGRFYPTHRLMPILNPQGFKQALQEGKTDDQMPQLNNRMDGVGRNIGRKGNRMDSFGPAVSHNAKLALEGEIKEEAFNPAR